jgi:hypothetical protein
VGDVKRFDLWLFVEVARLLGLFVLGFEDPFPDVVLEVLGRGGEKAGRLRFIVDLGGMIAQLSSHGEDTS